MKSLFALLLLAGCTPDSRPAVVKQYAMNLNANYADVVASLTTLQTAIDTFVDNPTADAFSAAQQAWLAARPSYGESEVGRFYGGPIDDVQGRVNEWPIDEAFIDYTHDDPTSGIINLPQKYPMLTPEVLASADEKGGIENLATGYHAIEYLLWGQRLDQTQGPGQRPYTDFVDGGTAANPDRRRIYLKSTIDLLVSDLTGVAAQWDLTDPSSYASKLVKANSLDGVQLIFRGLSNMAISELYYERMDDAYITMNRKDEQSCFSESTLADLAANAKGLEDAYLGRYGATVGASISDLVKAQNPTLDQQMRDELSAVRAAIDAIPEPYDHAVLEPVDSDPHLKVKAALDAFAPMTDTLHAIASLLGVTVNI